MGYGLGRRLNKGVLSPYEWGKEKRLDLGSRGKNEQFTRILLSGAIPNTQ